MKDVCTLLSSVLLIGGVGFLLAPRYLAAVNRWLNKTLLTTEKAIIYRRIAGTIFALVGLLILWLAWAMR